MQSRQLTRLKKNQTDNFVFSCYLCQTEHTITTAYDSQRYRELLYRDSIEPQITSHKHISKVENYKKKI